MKLKLKQIWVLIAGVLFFGVFYIFFKYTEQLHHSYISCTNSAEIIMFGDSHIANGKWYTSLNNSAVLKFGWAGYTTEMLLEEIVICLEYNPKYVFILCGGNDIYYDSFSVEKTLNNYKKMTDLLRKKNSTPVFQKLIYKHDDKEFNSTIDSINQALEKYCFEEGIEIIDIGQNMYDATGLKASLTYDNLHLNKKGYAIWSEAINNYLNNKQLIDFED